MKIIKVEIEEPNVQEVKNSRGETFDEFEERIKTQKFEITQKELMSAAARTIVKTVFKEKLLPLSFATEVPIFIAELCADLFDNPFSDVKKVSEDIAEDVTEPESNEEHKEEC